MLLRTIKKYLKLTVRCMSFNGDIDIEHTVFSMVLGEHVLQVYPIMFHSISFVSVITVMSFPSRLTLFLHFSIFMCVCLCVRVCLALVH